MAAIKYYAIVMQLSERSIPSFTKGKKQLSAKEVEISRQIASVRIHVERVIGLIKNRYKILDCVLPLTLLKTLSEEGVECEIANIDKLFTVCAVLVNLGEGIVYNEKVNNQDSESNLIFPVFFMCFFCLTPLWLECSRSRKTASFLMSNRLKKYKNLHPWSFTNGVKTW